MSQMKRDQYFSFYLTLILTLFSFGQADAKSKEITPDGFNWMSRTSIDIMKTYRHYNTFIEQNNPKFLFDAHTIQTAQNDYILPTSLGPITSGPIQGEMAIYYNWQINQKKQIGFFAFVNSIDLQIDSKLHPNLRDTDGPYGDLYGWKSAKYIMAADHEFSPDIKITLGALVNYRPYLTLAADSSQQFDIYYDEEKEEYRTDKDAAELFFHGTFYGYDIGTLYQFEANTFSLIELKRFFKMGEDAGYLALGYNHYSYLKTHQLGLEYEHNSLLPLPVHLEAYWNLYRDKKWNDIGYFLFSTRRTFLKDESPAADAEPEKDFFITAHGGISYSKDLFTEGLPGYFINFDMNHIWGYWTNLMIGYSYNYHDYLHRLPIKDEHSIVVAFRIMI